MNARHLDVRLARRRVAARMIMHQHDGSGVGGNRRLENFARMHQQRVNRSFGGRDNANQPAARVEQKHLKRLHVFHQIFRAQQGDDVFGIVEHGRFVLQFLRHSLGQFKCRHQRHCLVMPDAFDFSQVINGQRRQSPQGVTYFFNNCRPTSTTFAPFKPVRSRIAINSALLKAFAPFAASRSRGRSLAGWSLRRNPSDMVIYDLRLPLYDEKQNFEWNCRRSLRTL